MPTAKISATLRRDTLAAVRARAGSRGVSGYLEAAAREKLARDERRARILAYLEELAADDPISDEEREQAERRLARILGEQP